MNSLREKENYWLQYLNQDLIKQSNLLLSQIQQYNKQKQLKSQEFLQVQIKVNMQNNTMFWERNSLFRCLREIKLPSNYLQKIIAQKSFIHKNDGYQVGRKKVDAQDSYIRTKNLNYCQPNCNNCLKEKETFQIFHSCSCHNCQDWYGCSSPNDWHQIFFICKDCDQFNVISQQDQKKIRFPELIKKEEAQKRQRKLRQQNQRVIREKQLLQTAFKSKQQLDNFGKTKCKFGKYKNKSWTAIWNNDPMYITHFILSPEFTLPIKYKVSRWFSEL